MKLKHGMAAGLAALFVAGAALAGQHTKFAGLLGPKDLKQHKVKMVAGRKYDIEFHVKGKKKITYRAGVAEGFKFLKAKTTDEDEVKITFRPETTGQFLLVVRNEGGGNAKYDIDMEEDKD